MTTRRITIRLDEELYQQVKLKCNSRLGIGMSPLIKVFLKSFVTQSGVGFYVGDADLRGLFNKWLFKKGLEKRLKKVAKNYTPLPGVRLKDLYEL